MAPAPSRRPHHRQHQGRYDHGSGRHLSGT
jgi:hypothetical protein